jgi:nucleoside-diphosphate-sugar epimerase
MTDTYLITGGTGFLGSALVHELVAKGARVRVLDDNSRGRSERLAGVDVEMVDGDIRNPNAVWCACRGVDVVVHLAAVNGTKFFYEKPAVVLDVCIRGTMNVLDACRQHGIGQFILASTSEVYQTPSITPTPEDVPLVVPDVLNPRYSYGGSKIAAELMTVHSGLPRAVIFRPHNVYGPDMGDEHVVPQLIDKLLRLSAEQPDGVLQLPILGDGRQVRAFIHIDDFTRALTLVIERGEPRTVYHIGNPAPVSIAQLAVLIARAMGRQIELRPSEAPKGETPLRCPDITRIEDLGFEPKVSLYDGICSTLEWHRQRFAMKGQP